MVKRDDTDRYYVGDEPERRYFATYEAAKNYLGRFLREFGGLESPHNTTREVFILLRRDEDFSNQWMFDGIADKHGRELMPSEFGGTFITDKDGAEMLRITVVMEANDER